MFSVGVLNMLGKSKFPLILMFHEISNNKVRSRYTITKNDFINFISFVNDNKILMPSIDELGEKYIEEQKNSIIITFDDGYESDYNIVFNLLKDRGLKTTFFITTNFIGKAGYVSKTQIREMHKYGFSVQSHAKSHNFLTKIPSIDLFNELVDSKHELEDIIGSHITSISYPGGRYNSNVLQATKDAGYKNAFTSVPYQCSRFKTLYIFGRLAVKYNIEYALNIKHLLSTHPANRMLTKAAYIVRKIFKETVGEEVYHFLWSKYIGKQ